MEAIRDKNLDLYSQKLENSAIGQVRDYSNTKAESKINTFALKKYLIASSAILSLLLIICMVLSYTEMVSINSDKKIIEAENEDLELAINSLDLKLAPYNDRERIEKIALERIGMVYPTRDNIVLVNPVKNIADKDDNTLESVKEQETSLLSYFGGIFR